MRSYAIGDIHGHLDKLRAAHRLVDEDRARTGDHDAPLVHVGDLVDRGPDSRGVVAHLLEGQLRGEPWVVLKGNHDRMFYGFLENPRHHDPMLKQGVEWLDPRLGGIATLASYGVEDADDRDLWEVHEHAMKSVPDTHYTFLRGLPTMHRRGDIVFVHAGIRPGLALDRQVEDDLVWIRVPFLEDTRDHGPLVVHGHTAIKSARHHGNRVNIDSSVAYGGEMTVAVFEGRDVFLLTPEGRVRLDPE